MRGQRGGKRRFKLEISRFIERADKFRPSPINKAEPRPAFPRPAFPRPVHHHSPPPAPPPSPPPRHAQWERAS